MIRKITSMTMVWSFIMLIINSLVLYVVPEGRVAYWADWHFLGLTKSAWGDQHTTLGFLFLLSGILHVYYNWNPIMAYMKNKAKQVRVFTVPSSIALALTVFFVVGTHQNMQPMSTILDISAGFKESASNTYGEPPYGHAETSSLKLFSKRLDLDLNQAMINLQAAGITFASPKDTIKDIARNNNLTPQQVYTLIKPQGKQEGEESPEASFPDAPTPGWGKKTIAAICATYQLDQEGIVSQLKEKGIRARPDATVKEIAAENGINPMGVFEALYDIVTSKQ